MRANALLLALVLLGTAAAPAGPPPSATKLRVIAILSYDAEPYQQALAGFRRDLSTTVPHAVIEVVAMHGDAAQAREAVQDAQRSRPALLLTLGTLATRQALAEVRDVPIVAGMILNAAELGGAPNATGVYLEYPVEVELQWIRRLLPSDRRVGVIYHGAESARRVADARRAAPTDGLTIHGIRIAGPAELPDALASLSNRADVLWSVADPVVYNAETARALLLFSLRNRIPMVGQSAAWVKAGALYALDREYSDVGTQCAELAARLLAGEAPAAVPPVPPRKIRYALNLRTAAELRLELADATVAGAAEVVN